MILILWFVQICFKINQTRKRITQFKSLICCYILLSIVLLMFHYGLLVNQKCNFHYFSSRSRGKNL